MRVGSSYDAHGLVEGRKLILGGVEIPFEKGLLGWSDGDVVVHAVIDALFGAAGLGDMGTHFPSDDPKYENISSLALLRQTGELLQSRGWQVKNIDATILAQAPRLAAYIEEMRQRIAEALRISPEQVSVKATTTDGLGFVGRGEGIAAQAVALVEEES